MISIPASVALPSEEESLVPQSVAEITDDLESPESSPYVISFARYNEKMCEIKELDSNKAKKAIAVLKTIGTDVFSTSDFPRHNLDRIPIKRAGEYLKLYNRLGDDIEIREIKLQAEARIFYFDIESQRTFYVVAITQNHLETDKVRRK